MRYFYVSPENQAVGPLEAAAMEDLKRRGVITDATPVSCEGDAGWRTYAAHFSKAPPPLRPAPSGQAAPAARPTAITVFAICNIAFGGIGLLCLPAKAIGSIIAVRVTGSLFHSGWLVFSSVFGFFLAGALLASGFGMLRLRPWARQLAMTYCLFEIARIIVESGVKWQIAQAGGGGAEEVSLILSLATIGVQLVLGIAYEVTMFVMLRLPAAREAFQAKD